MSRSTSRLTWFVLTVIASVTGSAPADEATSQKAEEETAAQVEFFEKSVRPLLISACGDCHGEKKQWAGLRLDSKSAMLAGGDTGAAIIPGDPENSLLISAVRRTGDYEMPPEKPLNPEQIAILEKWVRLGAPWPEESGPAASREELARTHWAFQPLAESVPPDAISDPWCRTPVDAFVLAKLKENSLQPSAQVDRRTLIRRVTYDLTGLPPTESEVADFTNDSDPDAYAKLVERLLESPHYGEHWGRKWLDLARYADTKGYVYGREESRFVHSWTYRDWVVKALNEDMPYDRFLLLQIAADQAVPDDAAAQAALGFLTLGRRFLGNTHDIIDDRIDVLARTTMGLSVGCARCHDHKYDPIPTADYYSLYGVFQNSTDELLRLPTVSADVPVDAAYETGLKDRLQKLQQGMLDNEEGAARQVRARLAEYLFAQSEIEKYPDVSFSQIIQPNDMVPSYVHRWESYLRRSKKSNEPIFLPWHLYAALPGDQFQALADDVTKAIHEHSSQQVHPRVAALFKTTPASLQDVANRYGELFNAVESEWRSQLKAASDAQKPAPAGLADAEAEQLRSVLYGPGSPCSLPDQTIVGAEFFFDIGTTVAVWGLQLDLDRWLIDQPQAVPYTLRMVDRVLLEEPRIFRRGNPATKGDEVPRQLPLVIAGAERHPFQHGSGRLELAEGIVSPDNPLTARVWVNRIWQHHFGTGMVPTPSDFGTRAPRPEQLDLLDWLARKLIEEGWSTKAIHRQILLSAAYQQLSSGPDTLAANTDAEQVDPENKLIWKMNSHRLTFEELRDSMLAVSGELESTVGGRSAPLFSAGDQNHRRTLYGFVDRSNLPNVYRIFDFANPDLHIPSRSETTVSQQALFAMNNPSVAARAKSLAARVNADQTRTVSERISEMYARVYQRLPHPEERQIAEEFLAETTQQNEAPGTPQQLAWQYGYGSVDLSGGAVENFQKLPHFTGSAWQGGVNFPDPALGWVQITAEGGHPGNDQAHALVRRWTASQAGMVSIDSQARHAVAEGNGVRCWILSSRHGLLNQFAIRNSSQDLKVDAIAVQPGDTLDFVVDVNGELFHDEHFWTVTIESTPAIAGAANDALPGEIWNSRQDFTGPQTALLQPWEQLAQVLLLSNEFLFVD